MPLPSNRDVGRKLKKFEYAADPYLAQIPAPVSVNMANAARVCLLHRRVYGRSLTSPLVPQDRQMFHNTKTCRMTRCLLPPPSNLRAVGRHSDGGGSTERWNTREDPGCGRPASPSSLALSVHHHHHHCSPSSPSFDVPCLLACANVVDARSRSPELPVLGIPPDDQAKRNGGGKGREEAEMGLKENGCPEHEGGYRHRFRRRRLNAYRARLELGVDHVPVVLVTPPYTPPLLHHVRCPPQTGGILPGGSRNQFAKRVSSINVAETHTGPFSTNDITFLPSLLYAPWPETRFRCTGCDNAYYCDAGCQRLAWPLHRHYCGTAPVPPNRAAGEAWLEHHKNALTMLILAIWRGQTPQILQGHRAVMLLRARIRATLTFPCFTLSMVEVHPQMPLWGKVVLDPLTPFMMNSDEPGFPPPPVQISDSSFTVMIGCRVYSLDRAAEPSTDFYPVEVALEDMVAASTARPALEQLLALLEAISEEGMVTTFALLDTE
ncbi:hypothetical protein GALMADRAFT_148753 [Galerina marginata CBS 339.88]|uniref:MYND-type domain-containing protein n=1 Tax=Galerina marginata (strain CBS 339.88) TaxID=685588 RepID=A0A067S663_GALM3|nr:hypothetical protein GALMADRAFT_148753 [Galerina marginata CBS 339.88]